MEIPLEVGFKGVEKTDRVDALIREKVAKLEQVCNYLVSCRITVEAPQQAQQSGNPYRVRLTMRVPPGHDLVVKREMGGEDMHDSLDTVLRDVFSKGRRKLQEHVRKQRGEVKVHPEQQTTATVVRIFHNEGYGFIRTLDNREIYFHENSVVNGDFARMEIGTGVRYVEVLGEEGPQASTVEITGKSGATVPENE